MMAVATLEGGPAVGRQVALPRSERYGLLPPLIYVERGGLYRQAGTRRRLFRKGTRLVSERSPRYVHVPEVQ